MMSRAGLPECPVCGGAAEPLLDLPGQAIYQHPVPAGVVVPPPHRLNLSWLSCAGCGHAWQPDFNARQLEEIYRNHYYTPAPSGMGVQFRNEFLACLSALGVTDTARVLLEVGASDGDTLEVLRTKVKAATAYAYEPNHDNATIARQRGLDVREKFFADIEDDALKPVDLAYARHVIEHIFDFDEFFSTLDQALASSAQLVLETPSLDFHSARASIAPFHVEHVHVFSARSLVRLAQGYGWAVLNHAVTNSGNLIAAFARGVAGREPERPQVRGLQSSIDRSAAQLRERFAGRRLLFWGAGSAGIALATQLGREPDIWTDGNLNKVGKRYVGSDLEIVSPESAFAAATVAGDALVVVITSSFAPEILPRLDSYGWGGDVYDFSGKKLRTRNDA
jgi:Methyltransferase domain